MGKFKVKVGNEWVLSVRLDGVGVCGFESKACIFDENTTPVFILNVLNRFYNGEIIEFVPVRDEAQPESKPKELDLCEILKDAPKGLKLWSTVCAEVEFEEIDLDSEYKVRLNNNSTTAKGHYFEGYPDAECTLWPSKDNRDWSTFKLPYKLPVKGELCWTMSSVGNWVLRFATGKIGEISGLPLFFTCQNQKFGDEVPYQWQPLSEVPEVLKNHLKLK